MVLADLITKLRDVYALNATELPDATLTTLIADALKKVSLLYPVNELSYILSVADTTRYTVSHTSLIRIKEVYYPRSILDNPFGSTIPINVNVSPGELSRNYEFLARLKLMNEIYPFEGRIVDHNHFDLLPTPEESGARIYYEYLRYRTLAEMPDMFEDELIEYMFFVMKDRTFKKNAISSGDGYMFDRRGNISVEKETVDGNKAHLEIEKDIIAKIKAKVMKM